LNSKHIAYIALFTTLGLLLFIFESFIPNPLPGSKLGFANIATILALYILGIGPALLVACFRVFLGALILGNILSPAFFLSLGGALASTLFMGWIKSISQKQFSVIGISVMGALVHNTVQLLIAAVLIVKSFYIIVLSPYIFLVAIFTGLVIGFISYFLLHQFERTKTMKVDWYGQNSPYGV
jgi:heptaprenyl diphosphate synthase